MHLFSSFSSRWVSLFTLLFALSSLLTPAVMVKHENFKTCSQSGFCTRNRAYADKATSQASTWTSPYRLAPEPIVFKNGQLEGTILKVIDAARTTVRLPLVISFLESGTARVTVDEEKRMKGDIELRHSSKAAKGRYSGAASWAVVGGLEPSTTAALSEQKEEGVTKVVYGPSKNFEAVIRHAPFSIEFKRDNQIQVKFNDRGFLNVEHWRPKLEVEKKEGEEEVKVEGAEDESTWWEETFGGNTDSKPRGPESVALDISFPGYEHVFGIPEHAASLSLKETRGGDGNYNEPYRLYNADVFEYEVNSPMTLYGSIPFMQAHKKDSTVGVFWLNAAETWIDVVKYKHSTNPLSLGTGAKTDTQTHWISESGQLDVFVFLGPSPEDVTKAYGGLTGYTALPQSFAIAYHQCRWNYVTQEDVMDVDRKFDKHNIPYDIIWLDIEYTDAKKYFTFDPLTFGNPEKMQKQLAKRDRKLVAIIDPHIKNEAGYRVVDELKNKNLAVQNKDGNIFEGWCWPGSSYWVDCFNPATRAWWASLFKYDSWKGATSNLFLWNDMNEPSVFNGPETTMPKDNLHYGNWEHRDVHNIYGMTYHNATHHGLIERKKGEIRRPFVLTRAFFAGSQRSAAMWTGDNEAKWEHLAQAFPMLLSNGIAGFPFAGADVGGFFGNPGKDLLTRWYQAGAFYPFFRGHAHIDTRRREPYLAGEPYTSIITQALRLRYQLLPAWYTAFHEASETGTPIIRPHYYMFPSDERGFALDDQFFVGSTGLLVKPVVTEGADSVKIYIPDDEPYYDYFDYTRYSGAHTTQTISAPLEKIPLLMRGGHIIPRRDRPRRSSGLMKWDPFTLVIVLNKNGNAEGTLYVDDGETFDYRQGAFIRRRFVYSSTSNTLVSENLAANRPAGLSGKTAAYLKSMKNVRIEKIIIVGITDKSWETREQVLVREEGGNRNKGHAAKVTYHAAQGGKAAWAVIRDPKVAVGNVWRIDLV